MIPTLLLTLSFANISSGIENYVLSRLFHLFTCSASRLLNQKRHSVVLGKELSLRDLAFPCAKSKELVCL